MSLPDFSIRHDTNFTSIKVEGTLDVSGATVVGLPEACENTIAIRSLSDLPTPVTGQIQLANSTTYKPCGIVNLGTNVLVLGTGTSLMSDAGSLNGFSTNSSSPLISSTSGCSMENVQLRNSSGPGFSVSGSFSDIAYIINCRFASCAIAGQFNGIGRVTLLNCIISSCTQGFVFSNNYTEVRAASNFFFENTNTTFRAFRFASSLTTSIEGGVIGADGGLVLQSNGMFSSNASQSFFSFENSATTLPNINKFSIIRNQFSGPGTALAAGITTNPSVKAFGGDDIPDSRSIGGAGFLGNSTVTTISGIATFVGSPPTDINNKVQINPVAFMLDTNSERFQLNGGSDGLQYIGKEDISASVVFTASVTAAGAFNQNVGVVIELNGTAISESIFENAVLGSGFFGGITFGFNTTLTTNDILTVSMGNFTGANNLTVQSLRLSVLGL